MFSSLTTKLALRKVGIKSDTFDFATAPPPSKNDKAAAAATEADEAAANAWPPAWMSMKSLPLTAQAWLSPVPPPVPVAAECPKIGDLAPLDRDRQLVFGGGKRIVVLFLRCVGCAFAQNTFIALRTLANRHQGNLRCVAVSHSSRDATKKWLDLLGGAWNVEVLIDEDRAMYAAWGLGLGSVWYMFNPTTQMQGWKEKGWLGEKVAGSLARTGSFGPGAGAGSPKPGGRAGGAAAADEVEGPSTALGNKWQQAGVFAIDGRGTVVYAEKAARADDLMNLDFAVKALSL